MGRFFDWRVGAAVASLLVTLGVAIRVSVASATPAIVSPGALETSKSMHPEATAFVAPLVEFNGTATICALAIGLVIIGGVAIGLWASRMQVVGLEKRRGSVSANFAEAIKHNPVVLRLTALWVRLEVLEVRGLANRAPELTSLFRR